jgi:hypothetical protein
MRKRRILIAGAVTVVALGVVAATAISVVTTRNGGHQTGVRVARSTDATTANSTSYVNLPGATRTFTVPARRQRLVIARFTGESRCDGPGYCTARIIQDGVEMAPTVGFDFRFDSGSTDRWESNAMERSIIAGPGTHRVRVQYAESNPPTSFRLDDWHLSVELSAR